MREEYSKLYIEPYVYDADKKEYVFNPELGLLSYEFVLKQGEEPPEWLVDELRRHGKEKEMEEIKSKVKGPSLRVLTQKFDILEFEEEKKRREEEKDEIIKKVRDALSKKDFPSVSKTLLSEKALDWKFNLEFSAEVEAIINELRSLGSVESLKTALEVSKGYPLISGKEGRHVSYDIAKELFEKLFDEGEFEEAKALAKKYDLPYLVKVPEQVSDEEVKEFFDRIDELYEREAYEEIDKELSSPEAARLSISPLFKDRIVKLFDALVKDGFVESLEVALSIAKKFKDAFAGLRSKVKDAAKILVDMYISRGDFERARKIVTEFELEDLREIVSEEMFRRALGVGVEGKMVHPLVAEAYILKNIKKYSSNMVFDYLASQSGDLEQACKCLEESEKISFKDAIKSITRNSSSLKRISQTVSVKTFFVDEKGTKYDTGGESFQDWAKKYIKEHLEDVILEYGPIPEDMSPEEFLLSKGWSTVTVVCSDSECRVGMRTPRLYNLEKIVSLLKEYLPREVIVESYPSGITHVYPLGDILERF